MTWLDFNIFLRQLVIHLILLFSVYDFNLFRRTMVLSLVSVVSQEGILSISGVSEYIRALKKLKL